jgi:hypothetical protein
MFREVFITFIIKTDCARAQFESWKHMWFLHSGQNGWDGEPIHHKESAFIEHTENRE